MIPEKTNNVYAAWYYRLIGIFLFLVSLFSVVPAYYFVVSHYREKNAVRTAHISASLSAMTSLCRQFCDSSDNREMIERKVTNIINEAGDAMAIQELLLQFGIDLRQRAVINEIVKFLPEQNKNSIVSIMNSGNPALVNLLIPVYFSTEALKRITISSKICESPAMNNIIQKLKERRRFEIVTTNEANYKVDFKEQDDSDDNIIAELENLKNYKKDCRWIKIEKIVGRDTSSMEPAVYDRIVQDLDNGKDIREAADENDMDYYVEDCGPILENGYLLTGEKIMPKFSPAERNSVVSQTFKRKQGERLIILRLEDGKKTIISITVTKISLVSELTNDELKQIAASALSRKAKLYNLLHLKEQAKNGLTLDVVETAVLDLTKNDHDIEFDFESIPALMQLHPGDYQVALYRGVPVLLRYLDSDQSNDSITINDQIWSEIQWKIVAAIKTLCYVRMEKDVQAKVIKSLIGD